MLDTKGPEIRTGFFAAPNDGGKLTFKAGTELIMTYDYEHKSDGTKLACTYDKLATSVKVGANVLVADGSLVLEVVSLDPANGEVTTRVCNDQTIGERKNMNLPGVKVDLPVLQEKDVNDLVKFAVPQGVVAIVRRQVVVLAKTVGGAEVLSVRGGQGPRGEGGAILVKLLKLRLVVTQGCPLLLLLSRSRQSLALAVAIALCLTGLQVAEDVMCLIASLQRGLILGLDSGVQRPAPLRWMLPMQLQLQGRNATTASFS